MGLDAVELLMEVEEEFGISITDEYVATICTPGDLHRCVVRLLARRDSNPCASAAVFRRICGVIVDCAGVSRETLRPSSRFDGVVPRGRRRAVWKAIEKQEDFRLPPLRRPRWLRRLLLGLFLIAPLLPLLCYNAWGWPMVFVEEWPSTTLFCSWPVSWFALLVLVGLTQSLEVSAPKKCSTLASLARHIAPRSPHTADAERRPWTEDYVWARIQAIVAEVAGVEPDRVTKEARFAEDLGLG